MKAEFIIYLVLFVGGMFVRSGYESLKQKRRVDEQNKLLFVSVLIVMTLMWASWFAMCPLDALRLDLPGWIHSIGFGMDIAGMALAIAAAVQLRGLENIKHLVTSGVFSRIRHPMYAGFIMWIVGWSLYHGAITCFSAGLIGIGSILNWAKMEESRLEAAYGEE